MEQKYNEEEELFTVERTLSINEVKDVSISSADVANDTANGTN